MRLSKTDIIGGLPAAAAREIMRHYRSEDGPYRAGLILDKHGIDTPPAEVLATLTGLGYLEAGSYRGNAGPWWVTTLQGNALGMASFGKPISRATADRLLEEIIGRARAYNADPGKPMYVRTLTVFGSYLSEGTDPIGDLDIGLVQGPRITDPAVLRQYARNSGRTFPSYIDELFWPQHELHLHLKSRSSAISLTVEDLAAITDRTRVVYDISEDPEAVPPPLR